MIRPVNLASVDAAFGGCSEGGLRSGWKGFFSHIWSGWRIPANSHHCASHHWDIFSNPPAIRFAYAIEELLQMISRKMT